MLTNPPVLMTFELATQFHVHLPLGQRQCLNSVLNVKAVAAAFNQEKPLLGALFVIVQLRRLIVCSSTPRNICLT